MYSTLMCFVYVARGPERENKQWHSVLAADILLRRQSIKKKILEQVDNDQQLICRQSVKWRRRASKNKRNCKKIEIISGYRFQVGMGMRNT